MGAGIALILNLTVGLAQEKTGLAESLVGRYEHVPPQNDWHKVTIEFGTEGNLPWKNAAGRSWPLMIGDGDVISSTRDCPYGVQRPGIVRDKQGQISSRRFNDETYRLPRAFHSNRSSG